jgi:hypothetical protein
MSAQTPVVRSSSPKTTIPWTTYMQSTNTASDHHGLLSPIDSRAPSVEGCCFPCKAQLLRGTAGTDCCVLRVQNFYGWGRWGRAETHRHSRRLGWGPNRPD